MNHRDQDRNYEIITASAIFFRKQLFVIINSFRQFWCYNWSLSLRFWRFVSHLISSEREFIWNLLVYSDTHATLMAQPLSHISLSHFLSFFLASFESLILTSTPTIPPFEYKVHSMDYCSLCILFIISTTVLFLWRK